jgi:hypothetical protein
MPKEIKQESGPLVREVFREGVPGWEELAPQIRQWLEAGLDLEAIRERIFDHLMLYEGDDELEGVACEAMAKAFELVTGIIENLPVTEENLKRLMDYIGGYHDWAAYERLFSDFLPLMTEKQIRDILERAKQIFVPEVTRNWERNVRRRLPRSSGSSSGPRRLTRGRGGNSQ